MTGNVPTKMGQSHFERAEAEMLAKTQKCQAMTDDREAMLFSGMRANLHLPHPIYIASGDGPLVTDIDGNEYIDTCMGFGVCVLGHRHPDIASAIVRVSQTGWHFGIHSQEQLPLARLLHDAIPCAERILFCNTGSEATGYAMRAARAFTGKDKVGIFDGYWHGMHDYCMVAPSPETSRDRPKGVDVSSGVPKAVHDLIVPLPYRNPSALDIIRENRDELAMVIVEPVPAFEPAAGGWRLPQVRPGGVPRMRCAVSPGRNGHRLPPRLRRRPGVFRHHSRSRDPRQSLRRRLANRGRRRPRGHHAHVPCRGRPTKCLYRRHVHRQPPVHGGGDRRRPIHLRAPGDLRAHERTGRIA